MHANKEKLPKAGLMLNAYPDSIGNTLGDIVKFLREPELAQAFQSFTFCLVFSIPIWTADFLLLIIT